MNRRDRAVLRTEIALQRCYVRAIHDGSGRLPKPSVTSGSTALRSELPSYLEELQSVSELLLDDKKLSALPEMDRI